MSAFHFSSSFLSVLSASSALSALKSFLSSGEYMKTEKHILMDMDGVIVRGATVIPGAPEFIARLVAAGRKFLVLTNNPAYTPRDLSARANLWRQQHGR